MVHEHPCIACRLLWLPVASVSGANRTRGHSEYAQPDRASRRVRSPSVVAFATAGLHALKTACSSREPCGQRGNRAVRRRMQSTAYVVPQQHDKTAEIAEGSLIHHGGESSTSRRRRICHLSGVGHQAGETRIKRNDVTSRPFDLGTRDSADQIAGIGGCRKDPFATPCSTCIEHLSGDRTCQCWSISRLPFDSRVPHFYELP